MGRGIEGPPIALASYGIERGKPEQPIQVDRVGRGEQHGGELALPEGQMATQKRLQVGSGAAAIQQHDLAMWSLRQHHIVAAHAGDDQPGHARGSIQGHRHRKAQGQAAGQKARQKKNATPPA